MIAESERGQAAPVVFASGDGQFVLSMQGCHGGPPHARLRRLLALKRRVVLVDEYLTTKRCPNCRCETHLTKDERRVSTLYRSAFLIQPSGVAQYTRRDGAVVRKRVHGLSQCYGCATLWSRDYAATMNPHQRWGLGAPNQAGLRGPSGGRQGNAQRTSAANPSAWQRRKTTRLAPAFGLCCYATQSP